MNTEIVFTTDPFELDMNPIGNLFNNAYMETPALKGMALATMVPTDEMPTADNIVPILFRMYIENGARAQRHMDQKYVIGLRFTNMGDMATIDVISLDKGFHKDIAFEHLKRLGWPVLDKNMGLDKFEETMRAPFLVAGGFLTAKGEDAVGFSSSSSDYDKTIFFSDSNAIAAYAASLCGFEVIEGDKEEGKAFVEDLMKIMLAHKLKPDFYECLVEEMFKRAELCKKMFTSQHIGALMTMKVADRAINEEKDMLTVMVEELHGFARYFLIASVVHRTKEDQMV